MEFWSSFPVYMKSASLIGLGLFLIFVQVSVLLGLGLALAVFGIIYGVNATDR